MATFTNVAVLSYGDNTITSNVVTGELLEVLSGTKTALADSYVAGDRATFVIALRNTGVTALTDLTVTDNLGAYANGTQTLYPLSYVDGTLQYYIDGVLQATPVVTAGPPMTVTGITIPAGSNALLVYEAQVTGFAPLETDSTITNEATVTGGGLTTPLVLEETIDAADRPVLTITKALNPATVAENGQLTYTFVIQNTGNTAIVGTDDVVLTDTFDPILDPITVTFNGTVWTEGTNYTYDRTTGAFATLPGQITVPAATYTRAADGSLIVNPGVSTLTVTGTV